MALINCPECGKEISDKSIACINCGYPLDIYLHRKQENKAKEESTLEKAEENLSADENNFSEYTRNNGSKDTPLDKRESGKILLNKKFKRNMLIAALLVLLFSSFLYSNSTPSHVAEKFMKLSTEGNMKKAGNYLIDSIPWDDTVVSNSAFKIDIQSIEETIIDDEAIVDIVFNEIPEYTFGGNPQYVSIYLMKINNKWKIYDMQ